MERELPIISIQGTDFLVDVDKVELREKDNPYNVISLFEMRDVGDGYVFSYSAEEKNIPSSWRSESIPAKIPQLVELDPVGMANKYGLNLDHVKGKSDFDLMVDQNAYDMRVNKGMLPTVDIAGHTFYVDIRLDMLRPKDDFISKGIVFSGIDHYFSEKENAYFIPYNPKTHEFQELDYDKITEIPKSLIAVQIPFQRELDPIGWNRKHGFDIWNGLKETGLKPHFNARIVPWEETYLMEIIKENLKKHRQEIPSIKHAVPKTKKSKGRKM